MTDRFRVERYDPAWGGFRNDDLTPHDLTERTARTQAKAASRNTTQALRVVNERTSEVVVGYWRGDRISPAAATDGFQRLRIANRR